MNKIIILLVLLLSINLVTAKVEYDPEFCEIISWEPEMQYHCLIVDYVDNHGWVEYDYYSWEDTGTNERYPGGYSEPRRVYNNPEFGTIAGFVIVSSAIGFIMWRRKK